MVTKEASVYVCISVCTRSLALALTKEMMSVILEPSSEKLTWFEAQKLCRYKNQTLTLNQSESNQVYWTGFYKRTSHWIKIIGTCN